MPFLNSSVLDTAIAIVGVYITFSLFASWLNEQIASFFSLRSKTLVAGVRQLIGDAKANEFFEHGVIAALVPPAKKLQAPDYVSARQFAFTFLDILSPGKPLPPGPGVGRDTLSSIVDGIAELPDGKLQQQLLGLAKAANGDYDAFVSNVQGWYDDHMDRVSGWYKQHVQLLLFGIGLAIALIFNVDTLRLYSTLACRGAQTEQIAQALNGKTTPEQVEIAELSSLANLPIGWHSEPWTSPVGCDAAPASNVPRAQRALWSVLLLKISGILLTAIALSLGAPFWFDLLDNVMTVRNAGDQPATAKSTSS